MSGDVSYQPPEALSGVFWFSTVTAFGLAFAIGANDVANNFGTSVGSGAVTMRTAIVVAAVAEVAGAVTLGSGVSDTIVRGISDLESSECWDCGGTSGRISLFMLGMVCALTAGALFLLTATCAAMPVSTTHAIVGAVIGMTMTGAGPGCVKWAWPGLLSIAASWVLSPVVSGMLSALLLVLVQRYLLGARLPAEATLACMPYLGGGTLAMIAALLLLKAQLTKDLPAWATLLATSVVFMSGASLTQFLAVPRLRLSCRPPGLSSIQMHRRRSYEATPSREDGDTSAIQVVDNKGDTDYEQNDLHGVGSSSQAETTSSDIDGRSLQGDELEWGDDDNVDHNHQMATAEKLFMYLQVLTACLKSYAHGANDTANAAGPFTAVQALYLHGADDCSQVVTPLWVLVAGGAGIVIGLACLGYKVMETIGSGLTEINCSRGFCIELGSTTAVVVASIIGMPVSSTHCQVGSIVAIGMLESGASRVNWGLFSKIAISWLVTVPAAAALASGLLAVTKGLIIAV